jgi:hypothetical protein
MGRFVNFLSPALCPPHMPQSPGVITWAHGVELKRWNRQNHPERPLWPREIISPHPRHRAPVGVLPPSPEQRSKAGLLGKGVKPAYRAGYCYCRELEATAGGLSCRGNKPPFTNPSFGNLVACVGPTNYQRWQSSNPLQARVWP